MKKIMTKMLLIVLSLLVSLPLDASLSLTTTGGGTGNGGTVEASSAAPTFALANFTVAVWAKFQGAPNTTAVNKTFWSRINGSATVCELWWFLDSTGKVNVIIGNNHTVALANTAISDTNWHHFVLTKSGTTWTSFIDGVQDKQVVDATAQNNMNGTASIILGQNNASNFHCRCSMAEVAGWNVVLSAAEIKVLSKGGSPNYVRPLNLLLYVPMYSRSGTGGVTNLATPNFAPGHSSYTTGIFTHGGNAVTDNHCPGCSEPPGTN